MSYLFRFVCRNAFRIATHLWAKPRSKKLRSDTLKHGWGLVHAIWLVDYWNKFNREATMSGLLNNSHLSTAPRFWSHKRVVFLYIKPLCRSHLPLTMSVMLSQGGVLERIHCILFTCWSNTSSQLAQSVCASYRTMPKVTIILTRCVAYINFRMHKCLIQSVPDQKYRSDLNFLSLWPVSKA